MSEWYDIPSEEMTLEQARSAVRELRKKVAEQFANMQNEWISVNDRLPNRFEDVVVCTVSGGFDIGYIDISDLWSIKCTDSIITHWMPLPSTEGLDNET